MIVSGQTYGSRREIGAKDMHLAVIFIHVAVKNVEVNRSHGIS